MAATEARRPTEATLTLPTEMAAALALLHSADRQWLLERLSGDERHELRAAFERVDRMPLPVANSDAAPAKPPSADAVLLKQAGADELKPLLAELSAACVALLKDPAAGSAGPHFREWLISEVAGCLRLQRSRLATPERRFETLLDAPGR